MGDSRRSLSPLTHVYSGLQAILTSDQFDQIFPLINSAIVSNGMDDEEIARQEQERFYNVNSMEIDEPFPHVAASFNPSQRVDIDADAAYALRLQEEEYSRRSLIPTRAHIHEMNNKRPPPIMTDSNNVPMLSDAEIAAHLQAEENQRTRRHRQRPNGPPQRPTNRFLQSDEPELIPMPRATLNRPSPPIRNNNTNNSFANFLQLVAANGIPRSGARGRRDVQNTPDDFGPNDYERLLELDNTVGAESLNQEQINRLPTERFHRPKNKSDEENKCSICWDEFEQNQILRRLQCFHLYHRDCIDTWLKDKNQCPICRLPPIQ